MQCASYVAGYPLWMWIISICTSILDIRYTKLGCVFFCSVLCLRSKKQKQRQRVFKETVFCFFANLGGPGYQQLLISEVADMPQTLYIVVQIEFFMFLTKLSSKSTSETFLALTWLDLGVILEPLGTTLATVCHHIWRSFFKVIF